LPSLTCTTITFERIRTFNLSTFEHLALSFLHLFVPRFLGGTIIYVLAQFGYRLVLTNLSKVSCSHYIVSKGRIWLVSVGVLAKACPSQREGVNLLFDFELDIRTSVDFG